MQSTARKLLNLRKQIENETGSEARDITTNLVCLLHDVAKALGFSDRVANRITGDRLVDEPIFSRKRHISRARSRS
jgi:hypothetical protein